MVDGADEPNTFRSGDERSEWIPLERRREEEVDEGRERSARCADEERDEGSATSTHSPSIDHPNIVRNSNKPLSYLIRCLYQT